MPESLVKKRLSVDFEPIGRRVEMLPGCNLLEAAHSAGVDLVSICGGQGKCGKDRVRVMGGEFNQPTRQERNFFTPEDFEAGYRLACQSIPKTDVKIYVPPDSLGTPQRLQIEGQEVYISGSRVVIALDLQIDPAAMDDLRSDSARLRDALESAGYEGVQFSPQILLTISDVIRDNDWWVRVAIRADRVVAILPKGTQLVGLAVDVGTTKVAGYLLDLETGETLAKTGKMNPQISYGEDVISRIAYCQMHDNGRKVMQTKLVDTLNKMLEVLCAESGIVQEQIVEAVIVGNTAMNHLLAGLPVMQLAVAPYVPSVGEALNLCATDLGLMIAPGALIHLPPNIAGFVGADHVAMVLSTDLWKAEGTVMALDIGTNTEITLTHNGYIFCCSCASGPAFEGAHIRDGMRAAPGAIEHVLIMEDEPEVFTIGGQAPVGICGSGILDAVAEMVRNGIVNYRGALQEGKVNVQHEEGTNQKEYLLIPADKSSHGREVVVTRSDVNEIQLAKGAVRAGIEILLKEAGILAHEIDEFIVAGAFGTYLDVDSAVTVGMFPDLPRERFRQVGNAAGAGARQMLVSLEHRAAADQICARTNYIELTTHPGFQKVFMTALNLNALNA
jgi:uncharacterized 2Fe-2S/4Fe-4S cluster protein (DUF4445 family)